MDWLFDEICDKLYSPGAENNQYELEAEDGSMERKGWREAGIATAMVMKFADCHRLSVHTS
jgi:hypothetical protein